MRLITAKINLRIGRDGSFSSLESHIRTDEGLAVSGRLQVACRDVALPNRDPTNGRKQNNRPKRHITFLYVTSPPLLIK